MHSATCGLGKVNKKRKKKDSGELAADNPHRRIKVKVCMPGGLYNSLYYRTSRDKYLRTRKYTR